MARSWKLGVAAVVTTLPLCAPAGEARGALITDLSVKVTAGSGGLFRYDYTLKDDPASTLGASQLFLAVSPGAALTAVSGPAGWDVFYSAGDPDVSFLSSAASTDIAPGSSGSFSLTSAVAPAAGASLVRGFDLATGALGQNAGTVLTPSAVPEPPGLVLAGLAAALAGAYRLARRGPRAAAIFVRS
jgi:hypothetical protein